MAPLGSPQRCPACAGPVSPGNAILVCEFCGSSLLAPGAPPPGGMGAPVQPFGSPYGPQPAYMPLNQMPRRTNLFVFVAIGLVAMLGVMGAVAFFLVVPSPPPPPPPIASPHAPPTTPEPPPMPVDQSATALAMFDPKCSAGDASACIVCGSLYQQGQQGTPVDLVKARSYYDRACSLGNRSGCIMRDQIKRR